MRKWTLSETLGLLYTVKWIQNLLLEFLNFELDSRIVETKFYRKNERA
jgi:hypothetical protein